MTEESKESDEGSEKPQEFPEEPVLEAERITNSAPKPEGKEATTTDRSDSKGE